MICVDISNYVGLFMAHSHIQGSNPNWFPPTTVKQDLNAIMASSCTKNTDLKPTNLASRRTMNE